MKTLILLRHAKSSWDDADLDDFDRPLNKRGEADAPRMARWLNDNQTAPDRVLCSPAKRTRATLRAISDVYAGSAATKFPKALYMASSATLLAAVQAAGAGCGRLMVVGHNPGLEDLARLLIDPSRGQPMAVTRMRRKFPTAGVAVIGFDVDGFDDIAPASGRLTHFMTPRLLA